MIQLTKKEVEFKEFILNGNYSTDCALIVFWGSNPRTIQPYMKDNGISMKMLENVLNEIEREKKEKLEAMKRKFFPLPFDDDEPISQPVVEQVVTNNDTEEWRQIENFPEYECTKDGAVRRIDNKHIMKFSENDRYKLSMDGKIITVRLIDVVMPTWYAKEKQEKKADEYYDFSSSLELDDIY